MGLNLEQRLNRFLNLHTYIAHIYFFALIIFLCMTQLNRIKLVLLNICEHILYRFSYYHTLK